MSMTKMHFEALAEAMRETHPNHTFDGVAASAPTRMAALAEWTTIVAAVAQVCHDESGYTPNGNRRFRREQFIAACHPKTV